MKRAKPALVADVLTISRLGMAVLLVPAAWTAHLTAVSVLLSLAWLTDILDGRVARAGGVPGRLASWDLTVDTIVGVGLLIGLTGAGEVNLVFAAAATVGLGAWFITGNFAASLLLQLAGYLPFLAIAWTRRPMAWWLPFTTAIVIGVIDWRRLVTINIPGFVRSLIGSTLEEVADTGPAEDHPA